MNRKYENIKILTKILNQGSILEEINLWTKNIKVYLKK